MADLSGTPAYLQVAADLRAQITGGALPPGAQLPSMAQLRELYSVSNTVVRDALNELRREGLVIGQQGKGVFVRDTAAGTAPGRAPSGDLSGVMTRLDELADAVRGLDERMSRLEQAGNPAPRSRGPAS
ncbi:MAG: winged helix-turn-helix domain-containing protein [Actinomycetota bacterium]|nr:winged helix-turn-helix domain-containing protein [Actinomycetota bacterium]